MIQGFQFGNGTKTKLPFGFKVQHERMELHKTTLALSDISMDAPLKPRTRPETAHLSET